MMCAFSSFNRLQTRTLIEETLWLSTYAEIRKVRCSQEFIEESGNLKLRQVNTEGDLGTLLLH